MQIKLNQKRKVNKENVKSIIHLIVYILVVGAPIIAILIEAIKILSNAKQDWLYLAIPTGRRLKLLIRSVGLAGSVAAFGAFIGIFAGSYIYSIKSKLGHYIRYVILIFAVLPPYIHALSWSLTLHAMNSFLSYLQLPNVPLYGLAISFWVQLMAFIPFGIGLSILGFEMVDPQLIEAANIQRDDFYVWKKIIFPLILPAVTLGSAFMLLLSLMDYSIPSLFQVNVYSLEIFSEFSATYQPIRAFVLSLPLFLISLLILPVIQTSYRSLALSSVKTNNYMKGLSIPKWMKTLQYISVVVLFAQITVPITSLIIMTRSLPNFFTAFSNSSEEISYTFLISIVAVILSIPFAMIVAHQLRRRNYLYNLWWIVLIIPIILPAPLIGISIIIITNWLGVSGNHLVPAYVGVVRFIPFAALIVLTKLKQLDPSLIEAATILQRRPWQTLFLVKIPLISRSILAAASLVFILTIGELGASLMVTPPGKSTVTIKIYNYLHYGETETVAGLSLVVFIISVITGIFIIKLLFKNRSYQNE